MEKEKARLDIQTRLKKIVDSNPNIHNAFLLIHSDKEEIHWNMAAGKTDQLQANAGQPYHTASIAKTFTATIMAMLVEEGKVHFNDPISKYLSDDLLRKLHVYKGKDYSDDIRIDHLLSHTSGLPDFYEDKPKVGKPFLDIILEDSSRFWTAEETILWSKQHLQPYFQPGGKKCHYTNTGYNLLGLIIENITSKPYHEVLHDYIFTPLNMNDTYLSQYSTPAIQSNYPVANINIKGKEIKCEEYRSFSSIYAGGQTVSTSEDLFTFMKALVQNKLIREETLLTMQQWNKLWIGVEHGFGLMKIRMAPFTEKYNAWGHLGSIGSFMLYNPQMDVYIIGNFNKSSYTAKSIRFVFNTLRTVSKAVKEKG